MTPYRSQPFRHALHGGAALCLLVSFASACGRKADGPAPGAKAEAPAPLVEALQARKGTLPLELRVSGVVRAQNQVQIRPEISAMVAEVLVKSGDRVSK